METEPANLAKASNTASLAMALPPLPFSIERWLMQEPVITKTETKPTIITKRTAEIGPTKETKYFYPPFRFFDLPRELRDMIYDKVWPGTPRKEINMLNPSARIDVHAAYKQQIMEFETMKQFRETYVSTYVSFWTLVSRRFLNEAMAQYFRRLDWHAKIHSAHFSTHIYFSTPRFVSIVSVLMQEELEFSLANRKLTTSSTHIQKPLKLGDSLMAHVSILKKLQPSLTGSDHQRTLHITFGILHTRHQEFRGVDLSAFAAIGFELDKLVVEVICTRMKKAETVNRTYGLLNKEIRRLGSIMIGSSLVVKHTKTANTSVGKGIIRLFEVTRA